MMNSNNKRYFASFLDLTRILRTVSMMLFITLFFLSSCAQLKKIDIPLEKPQKTVDVFRVKWSKNLDPIHDAGNLPIGTASPLIHEDILYAGSMSGAMSAFDLESGRLIWSENEEQPISSKASLFGEHIIYGTKLGRVFSRHYLTGKLNYSIDLGSSIESAPVIYAGRMFIHMRNHKIIALDAATGKILWGYQRSIPYTTTLQRVSQVLPYNNRVVVGFADGHVGAISIEEGVVVWEQKITNNFKFIDVDVNPVLFNNRVVVCSANGDLTFLNPENGVVEKTLNVTLGHTPVILDDTLYGGTTNGEIISVDMDGNLINSKKVAISGITSLVPWQASLVASTMNGKILSIDRKGFEVQDTFELGSDLSTVFGELQQAAGHLAVYSSRNRLYLFK